MKKFTTIAIIIILLLIVAFITAGVIFGNWTFWVKTPSGSVIINDKTKDLVKTTNQLDSFLVNKIADDLINARTLYTTNKDDLDYIRKITGRLSISDELTRMMILSPNGYERNSPGIYTKITKEMILDASTKWSSVTGWEKTPEQIVIILQDSRQIRAFKFNNTWFWY